MIRAALLLALVPFTTFAQSDSRQQALGKQLADVEGHSTIVHDATTLQYVSRIAEYRAGRRTQDPLTVNVITGDTAYAFPGASCYVNTGLILKALKARRSEREP